MGGGGVIRRPAAAFLFVRVLAKQWVSQEGPRRQASEVQRRFEGHGTEEAAGGRGRGLLSSPAVLSMSCLATGQFPGQGVTEKKGIRALVCADSTF